MADILIVDDDPGTLDGYARILRCAGYFVWTSASGRDALTLGRKRTFDLVLADLRLPDVDGLHVLRELRMLRPRMPIVIATGFATIETAVAAIQLGAATYVEKPLFEDDLTGLAGRYCAPSDDPPVEPPGNPHVAAALAFIAAHYHEPSCSARVTATALGISEEHLCRTFKQVTGRTMGSVIAERRLRRARILLVASTLSVKEVASQSGYTGWTSLERHFKRAYRATPIRFRQLHHMHSAPSIAED